MSEQTIKRWYEKDAALNKCLLMLENLSESLKRKTATFLMEEIINQSPYSEMLPEEVYDLATGETQKRRWYDFDEVVRIFIELIRHTPEETQKETAIKAIQFIESLLPTENKSVEIVLNEEEKYL